MTEKEFQNLVAAADTFRNLTYDPFVVEFWTGYIQGIHRLYHGVNFGTDEEHAKLMGALNSKDESLQKRGAGYTAGFTGVSIEEAMIMAEEGRMMPP